MDPTPEKESSRLRPQDWDLIVATVSILVGILYVLEVYTDPMVANPLLDIKHYEDLALQITDGTFSGAFFVDPFYLLVRAGIMGVFGFGFWPPILLNLAALALSAVALRRIASRMVNARVGLVAALLLPLCTPLLFYQALAMKETLALAFLLWSMLLLMRFLEDENRKDLVGAGVLLALAVMTRGNLLIMAPALGLTLVNFKEWKSVKAQSRAFIFVLAFVLPILPVSAWNYSQTGEVIPITYNLGNNFYQGNNPEYGGTDFYNPTFTGDKPAQEELGWRNEMLRRLRLRCEGNGEDCTSLTLEKITPSSLSSFWFREGLNHVWEEPAAFFKRTTSKLFRLLSNSEVTNNIPVEYLAEQSTLLGRLSFGFGLLVFLAFLGLPLAWSRMRHKGWVFGATALYCMGVSVFYLITRLKIPLVPILLIPAVAGTFELTRFKELARKEIVGMVILGVFGSLLAFHPYEDRVGPGYVNLGDLYRNQQNVNSAVHAYEMAIEKDPKYAIAYMNLARVLLFEGRKQEARMRVSELEALLPAVKEGKKPKSAPVRGMIGSILLELNEAHHAVSYLEQALAGGHRAYWVLDNLWACRRKLQQPDAFIEIAEREFRREARPQVAWLWADALDFKGDYRAAAQVLQSGIDAFPYELPLQERLKVIKMKIRP